MTQSGEELLAEYVAKRCEWLEWIRGKDRHALMQQMSLMVLDTAAYRVIYEARKLADSVGEDGVALSGLVHNLIDRCFFHSQAVGIRRLVDPRTDVISLSRLLNEMKTYTQLMTRENMLAAEGLVYDYEALREQRFSDAAHRAGEARLLPASGDWTWSERRHKHIDRLCGVDETERKPSDTVRAELLSQLETYVRRDVDDVRQYVHKFLAHAADVNSRRQKQADDLKMTYGHLLAAHEVIGKTIHFIAVEMLGGSSGAFLPVMAFDQFEYIDRPLVTPDKVDNLRQAWRKYEKETEDWQHWDWDEFERQAPQLDA